MRVAERIRDQTVEPGAVAIWWLGQNSYVVKGASCCIMIDPFFSRPGAEERYVLDAAPLHADEIEPDAVLCTHSHYDHTDPPFLSHLAESARDTQFLGPPESVREMVAAGVPRGRTAAVESGQVVQAGGATIRVVLSKTPAVSDVAHFGYLVECDGMKVYDTGDIMRGVTGEESLLAPLREAAPHVALITTSPTEEEFPDFAEAAKLAIAIGVRVAIPAHYHCFAKRTFDPAPFVEQFPSTADTIPAVIPYCECYVYSLAGDTAILPGGIP
jgi:L-ascorbate 6-phosphate lactonase